MFALGPELNMPASKKGIFLGFKYLFDVHSQLATLKLLGPDLDLRQAFQVTVIRASSRAQIGKGGGEFVTLSRLKDNKHMEDKNTMKHLT
jgi:hypothetical protein